MDPAGVVVCPYNARMGGSAISSGVRSSELVQSLASYLPRYQLQLIAQRVRHGPDPRFANRHGAILLVDVSGFSALTERFVAQGATGAEELSLILNRYFGQMVDIITACGGDIVAFAGDSAIAMWPGEESDLAAHVLRATQAALRIQTELDRYEPIRGVSLRQRAGVGCGVLRLMELGGISGHWQFVVTGDPITQAVIANQQAPSGDVFLSSSAWKFLRNYVRGTQFPSGLVRADEIVTPELLPLPPAQVTPALQNQELLSLLSKYVPAVVSERLHAGQENWIAEFRTLSMLFLNLSDCATDDPAAGGSLQQEVCCIQETLERFEGTLYQFLMDDKGLTAVCAFGLPPLAHENDPRRAIEAAMALSEQLAKHGISSSAGIATGPVFCGVYGNANRRQYTTLGSTINLAARLMQAAQGNLLCDGATFQAAASAPTLQFQSEGKIPVKGYSALVPVFAPSRPSAELRADGSAAAGLSSAAQLMVGRERERAALGEALTALIERGEGRCFIVEGDAGVGKSCLLDNLASQVAETDRNHRKITCWRAAGDAIQQSTPYHAWGEIFRAIFDLVPAPLPLQRDHVLAQLAAQPDLLPLAPLLNVVIPLAIPENTTTASLDGQARAENTQNLLITVLKAATRSATVVILEDAHWFDSSSWRLALLAAQQIAPVLLVLSTRPFAEPPAELTALLALPGTQALTLGTVDPALALQIVSQNLGVSRLPPEVANFIHQRAAGHPLFSLQLAYAMRDAGLLEIANGNCQIPETVTGAAFDSTLAAMRFPSTVEGVITSRLDRMPTDLQLTVKVASILGYTFDLAPFREIYPVETARSELLDQLKKIEQLDLIHRTDATGSTYSFKHAIIQDVAYNCIPFSQRRELHRSVAEWYEREFRDNLPSQYPLLAHHWSRAEVAPKAIHYCAEAGSQALRNHANQEAVRFLSEVLSFDEKQQKQQGESYTSQSAARSEWELQLGRAYVNWSKYVEGDVHLERGLSLQGQKVPAGSIATISALLIEVMRQCGHRALPARYLGRRRRERESLLKFSRSFEALTEIFYLQNKSLHCLFAVLRSLNLAELAGASSQLARSYSSAGSLLGFMTLHRAADAYFNRAEKISTEIKDPASRAWVLLARAMYLTGVGHWELASGLLTEATSISDQLGDRRRGDDARITLLLVQILQGFFHKSLASSEALYTSAKDRLDIRIQSEALYGKAWSLLALARGRELPDCLDELDSLRSAQVKMGGRHQKQDVYSLYALLHLSKGDLMAAKQAVDRATRAMTGSFVQHNDILVHSAVTEVSLDLWQRPSTALPPGFDRDQLPVAARKAIKALHRYSRLFPIGKPLLYLRQGQLAWLHGKPKRALQLWERSLQSAISMQAFYYQGLAHLELSNHLASSHPAKSSHLCQAEEVLTRLGAARDLARLQTPAAVEARHGELEP